MAEYTEESRRIERQERGSAKPEEGKCGAKLKLSSPPRYCTQYPITGRSRCAFHGGMTPCGPASGTWKDGSSSKYRGVLPVSLAKHFDTRKIAEAASCAEELALVDARIAEVLENIRDVNPTSVIRDTGRVMTNLSIALMNDDCDTAKLHAARLEQLLGQTAAIDTGWNELHRLFSSRAKLSTAELGWQKLLADKILATQIDAFIRALIREARSITDDRAKLTTYILRVLELGTGAIGPAMLPSGMSIIDGELVGMPE